MKSRKSLFSRSGDFASIREILATKDPITMHTKYSLSDRTLCLLMCIGCVSAIISLLLTPWNEWVSQCLAIHQLPGDCKKIVQLTEVFGHGIGVLGILGFMAVLEPKQKRAALFVGIIALGAGGLAEMFNAFVGLVSYVPAWRSFPSGHGATAAALAIGLTLVLPRGKWFFCGLAVLTMIQQVADRAHFLSDVLAGAAIGFVWTVIFLRLPVFQRLFATFEAYWDRRFSIGAASASEIRRIAAVNASGSTDPAESAP